MDSRKKNEIEVDDVEDLRVFRETIEMMFEGVVDEGWTNMTKQLARRYTSFPRRQWRCLETRVRAMMAMTGEERTMRAMAVIGEKTEGGNKSLGYFCKVTVVGVFLAKLWKTSSQPKSDLKAQISEHING